MALPTVKPRQGACCHIASVCMGLLHARGYFMPMELWRKAGAFWLIVEGRSWQEN